MVDRPNNETDIIGFLWGLSEIISLKSITKFLARNKGLKDRCHYYHSALPCILFLWKAFLFFFSFNVYLFILRERVRKGEGQRERERVKEKRGGGGERQRERERQSIQSRLCTDSREPDVGLEPTNRKIMTWAKVRHLTNWATQGPLKSFSKKRWSGSPGYIL